MKGVMICVLLLALVAGPMFGESHGKDVRGEEVTYEADGVTLKGYVAWDAAVMGKRPGVLIVHEWWGHNEYVRNRARMLAEMGYTALALDMYGEGKVAAHPGDAQTFAMEVMSNMDAGVARFEAARKLLQSRETTDPERIAAIGYCFGGSVVLHMARIGTDLDGVASFHGGLGAKAPAKAGTVKARVLVANGGADPMVTAEQIDAFRREMEEAGVDLTFISYPGALHAFTNPEATELGKKFEMPIAYDHDADVASWAELEKFLDEVFGEK